MAGVLVQSRGAGAVAAAPGATAHSDLTGLTSGDDHTQYQKESERAAASGYASLDGATKVPIAQIPTGTTGATVALGNAPAAAQSAAEATAAAGLAGHIAGDPHSQYLQESAAAAIATSGSASDLITGTLAIARIADGTITLVKQADMPTARIRGRTTAGTGVPEDLTVAQVAAMLASAKLIGGKITATGSPISTTEAVMVGGTIPANTLAAGDAFIIEAYGRGTTGGTAGTGLWQVRVGPTTLTGNIAATTTALTLTASRTDKGWRFRAQIAVFTIGAGGTIVGSMEIEGRPSVNDFVTTVPSILNVTTPVAIDTTVDNLIELTFVTSQAGSSAAVYNGVIHRI